MRMLVVLLLMLGLALTGCASGDDTAEDHVIEATGTVQFVEIEGGFYGIVGEDGTRYDPSGLPEEFQEDGLRVGFRAEPRENVLTTRMWGEVVHLLDIKRL